jgi:hypothetical protein
VRRLALGGAVLLVALPVLGLVGRWEGHRQLDGQVDGIERVRAAVGPVDSASLTSFRGPPGLDCLDYRAGTRRLALELCFDASFRVVQASDRRGVEQHVYSVKLDPSARVPVLPAVPTDRALAEERRKAAADTSRTVILELESCRKPAPSLAEAARRCAASVDGTASLAAAIAAVDSPGLSRSYAETRALLATYLGVLDGAMARRDPASAIASTLRRLGARARALERRLAAAV